MRKIKSVENQISSLEESVKGDYPLNIPARGVAVKSAGSVKKIYVTIGDEPVELSIAPDEALCLRCKHFDLEAYKRDIVERKKRWSLDACKSIGFVRASISKVACSRFEKKR
jgi:hypothetical protein